MSNLIDQTEFDLPEDILKFILPSEMHSALYLAHLETKLKGVDEMLQGGLAINEDNVCIRITLLRQKRVAYVNAINQMKDY